MLQSIALCAVVMAGNPATSNRNWVYFADKGLSGAELAHAIADLENTASPAAVARRRARRTASGLFDERDLPVANQYIERLKAAGLNVRNISNWLNAVSVEGDIRAAESLSFVQMIAPVRIGLRREDGLERVEQVIDPAISSRGPGPGLDYALSNDQLYQIAVPQMHQRGFTGKGIIIGILDTGFMTNHVAFHQSGHELSIVAAHDFINNDDNVGIEPGDPDGQHSHGSLILGCIASYMPGSIIGGAFDAQFVLCKTEDVSREVPVEEDNYVAGLEFAEQQGADVVTSSLGYIDWYTQAQLNGATAVTTLAVNIATENGVICCTAAGNAGHDEDPATSHLIAPADALRVFTCGAVASDGVIAGFSSDGPTADGRIKPEILARGVSTRTIHPDNPTAFVTASGTSLSTPLVASAMACLSQARPWWSVDRVRAAVTSRAGDFVANGVADPLYVRGYGILNINAAIDVGCPADFNGDQVVDFFDYLDFVDAFSSNSRVADFNGDAVIDFFDYLDFVDAFAHHC